ncbi:MAG: hypothetical protein HPY45_17840 [Anaerolineae bacterium]|nr:hypothetical protein [Anaerolineae bacterium]
MPKKKFYVLVLSVLALLALFVIPARAQTQIPPEPITTPAPESGGDLERPDDPPPGNPPGNNDSGSGRSGGGTITQIIIHKLLFPVSTISEALSNVFYKAAERESRVLTSEINRWASLFANVISPPSQGQYAQIARSALPVAAALAPALFLLRLALHHWQNLTGKQEGVLEVAGDWLTAGALALASGPLLDLFVRIGFWAAGMVVGETTSLARQFVSTLSPTEILASVGKATLLGPLIAIGLGLGAVLAVAGMVMAFAASSAALYILAALAAPMAVVGVLPQMRWTRSLWLKAVLLVSLVPLIAGGIFKAGLMASLFFQGGLLAPVVRIIWLWGAVGALLSLAGALGKVTLGTVTDTVGKTVGAVKSIAGIVALGAATGGAGAAAGAAVSGTSTAAGSASAVTSGTSVSTASSGLSAAPLPGSGEAAAIGHLTTAQSLVQKSGTAGVFGFNSAAQLFRSQAQTHQIAAQRALLEDRLSRMADYGVGQSLSGDFAANASSQTRVANGFGGNPDTPQFREAYGFLSNQLQQRHPGLSLEIVSSYHPEEIGWMMRAYVDNRDTIEQAEDPIRQAALLAKPQATSILHDLYGEQK